MRSGWCASIAASNSTKNRQHLPQELSLVASACFAGEYRRAMAMPQQTGSTSIARATHLLRTTISQQLVSYRKCKHTRGKQPEYAVDVVLGVKRNSPRKPLTGGVFRQARDRSHEETRAVQSTLRRSCALFCSRTQPSGVWITSEIAGVVNIIPKFVVRCSRWRVPLAG